MILRERNVLTHLSLISPVSTKVIGFLIKRDRPGQSSSTAFATRLPPCVPPGTQDAQRYSCHVVSLRKEITCQTWQRGKREGAGARGCVGPAHSPGPALASELHAVA